MFQAMSVLQCVIDVRYIIVKHYHNKNNKLEFAKFLFGSVASLKFDCLVQTGVVGIVNNQIFVPEQMLLGQMLHGQMLHGQMLHGQMLHGQMVLGRLSTVKDGSTNLKWPFWYFPWVGKEGIC